MTKPTIDLYIGDLIDEESETKFLHGLVCDLADRSIPASIFANFFPGRSGRQIDFFVITSFRAFHIELKNYDGPIVARPNGPWFFRDATGALKEVERKTNPFQQARAGTLAISDEMRLLAKRDSAVPRAPQNKGYYTLFDTIICIPRLHAQSQLDEFKFVRILDYDSLLELLTSTQSQCSWNRKHWENLAEQMGLVRVDIDEVLNIPGLSEANQTITDYTDRFKQFYAPTLTHYVPTMVSRNGAEVSTTVLGSHSGSDEHWQMLGESGAGKSICARKVLLEFVEAGYVPIILPAIHFEGSMNALLNRSIAHLRPNLAARLLKAIKIANRSVALLIDGFNECPLRLRDALINSIHAISLRWRCRILITSQVSVPLPQVLRFVEISFTPPTNEERQTIFDKYLSNKQSEVDADWLSTFTTPYELSLAAECCSEMSGRWSTYELFDMYVNRRLNDNNNPLTARQVLYQIARTMSKRLVRAVPSSEVSRIGESVIASQNLPTAVLENLWKSGLFDTHANRVAFRHERLAIFFEAEALLRDVRPCDLVDVLALPRHRHLAELVIAAQSEPDTIRDIFVRLLDAEVLIKAGRGRLGATAQDVVLRTAQDLLGKFIQNPIIERPESLQPFELLLLRVIGHLLAHGYFYEEVVKVIEATDSICAAYLKLPDAKITGCDLFREVYPFIRESSNFGISLILAGYQGVHAFREDKLLNEKLIPYINQIETLSPGVLYLVCHELRHSWWGKSKESDTHVRILKTLPSLLQACLKTEYFHLEAEALQLVADVGRYLENDNPIRDSVIDILSATKTRNSFLMEARIALGEVQSPVDETEATEQIIEILSDPHSTEKQRAACSVVSNIFEEVYGATYGCAIDGLNHDQKVQLHVMAAFGAETWSFIADWTLYELLELNDPQTLPGFQRWAKILDPTTPNTDQMVKCFLLAHIGCARFMESPVLMENLQSDDLVAWQTYGEIVFWLHKPYLSTPDMRTKCLALLDRLKLFPNAAVDPLQYIESSSRNMDRGALRIVQKLRELFTEEFRALLEHGFRHRNSLTSIFDRSRSWGQTRDEFIVRSLGKIGNPRTAELLEEVIDDPILGRTAIEVIRQIKTGCL